MSFEEKQQLIQAAFSGKDSAGNRLGVYVWPIEGKGNFRYEIRGLFGSYESFLKSEFNEDPLVKRITNNR